MRVLGHLAALWRVLTQGNTETALAIQRARSAAGLKHYASDEAQRVGRGLGPIVQDLLKDRHHDA